MTEEKINYQRLTDEVTEARENDGKRERLLRHACCAPCSSYVLEYLTRYFDITVFFSNQNITDAAEYRKRLGELYKLCEAAPFGRNINIVEDSADPTPFYKAVKGLENEPEGGKRCTVCFKLRLSRTADYAAKNGFPLFATTLTVSPHKNADLINRIGYAEAERAGVKYLPSDFKKRGGYQRSIVLSKEYGIYRQRFCGCEFSNIQNR